MYGYVLASCEDVEEGMWRPLQPAVKHITTVESHTRAAARVRHWLHPRVTDAELMVRREWQRIGAEVPTLSLAALIELESQRYSIWSTVLDLQPVHNPGREREQWLAPLKVY